jgi:Sigma-54 interaction domain
VDVACAGEEVKRCAERARRELLRVGVKADGKASDVLLVADAADGEVVWAVRQARLDGARRVLVALPSPESLIRAAVWEMLEAGACDVFCWSEDGSTAPGVCARLERWREVDELMGSDLVAGNLVGSSEAFRSTLRQLVEIGRFTDASVLLTGESGTGKELAARLIHALDARRQKGQLVVVDCTTVVPSLSGSEFFGHERGAFTGAVSAREGAFALGSGGTVFLDEVAELSLELQAELLRVVQERAYKPVGSNRWRETDFRLICATNRDLEQERVNGGFRRDFYFRIAEWICRMPRWPSVGRMLSRSLASSRAAWRRVGRSSSTRPYCGSCRSATMPATSVNCASWWRAWSMPTSARGRSRWATSLCPSALVCGFRRRRIH